MNTREKLLKKAHNIKKNNLSREWRGATLTRAIAEKLISKFHAYQAYRERARTKAERRRRQVVNKNK